MCWRFYLYILAALALGIAGINTGDYRLWIGALAFGYFAGTHVFE
jgi:hypothetical protein